MSLLTNAIREGWNMFPVESRDQHKEYGTYGAVQYDNKGRVIEGSCCVIGAIMVKDARNGQIYPPPLESPMHDSLWADLEDGVLAKIIPWILDHPPEFFDTPEARNEKDFPHTLHKDWEDITGVFELLARMNDYTTMMPDEIADKLDEWGI